MVIGVGISGMAAGAPRPNADTETAKPVAFAGESFAAEMLGFLQTEVSGLSAWGAAVPPAGATGGHTTDPETGDSSPRNIAASPMAGWGTLATMLSIAPAALPQRSPGTVSQPRGSYRKPATFASQRVAASATAPLVFGAPAQLAANREAPSADQGGVIPLVGQGNAVATPAAMRPVPEPAMAAGWSEGVGGAGVTGVTGQAIAGTADVSAGFAAEFTASEVSFGNAVLAFAARVTAQTAPGTGPAAAVMPAPVLANLLAAGGSGEVSGARLAPAAGAERGGDGLPVVEHAPVAEGMAQAAGDNAKSVPPDGNLKTGPAGGAGETGAADGPAATVAELPPVGEVTARPAGDNANSASPDGNPRTGPAPAAGETGAGDGPAAAAAETAPAAGGRQAAAADAAGPAAGEKPRAREDNTGADQLPAAAPAAGLVPRDLSAGAVAPRGRDTSPEWQPTATPDSTREDTAAPTPMREVSIRIANENSQTADVRMTERNGVIQVEVRASDASLANSLRSDVGELVRGLAPGGLGVEVWHAGSPSQTAADGDARGGARGEAQSQPRNGQDAPASGSQQRNGDGGRRQAPPWLDELESIPNQVRRKSG
jgi:hypothetical protein